MRRTPSGTLLLAAVAALSASAPFAAAQSELRPRVSQIRGTPQRYLNERVRVEGYVTQYVDAGTKTTALFYLKDDWGGLIRVRTSGGPPAVGKRYAVVGPVGFDPVVKDAYISEESREELRLATEAPSAIPTAAPATWAPATAGAVPAQPVTPAPAPAAAPVEPAPAAGLSTGTLILLGVLGVLFVGIVVALVVVLGKRKPKGPTTDFDLAAARPAEAAPAPQEVIEGRTIKMHAPPPNTIKLAPGWLEVVSGDDVVKQIRFYKLKGEPVCETTFGRAAGRPYVHIQLKPMTVSSRQAKLTIDQGVAKLTNYAPNDSNPTKLNGREMGVDEAAVLKDGDVIEMGEVQFKFHAA